MGGTAKVFDGHLTDGQRIVLKAQRFRGRPDPAFELEIELFRKLFHRNIVHCVGEGRIGPYRVIGFRRAYTNPLVLLSKEGLNPQRTRDKSARYTNLPLDTALDLSYELYNALAYLEKLGFVHHDVKLSNVLVDVAPRDRGLKGEEVVRAVARRHYRAVLIDFGATRSRTYLNAWNRGEAPAGLTPQITPIFAPPEALVESRQDDGKLRVTFHRSLDTYAAALMTYSLLTGHPPYSHLETELDLNDLETVIGLKSAERRGEIQPISGEVLRRVVYEDTKFLEGSRASFDLAIERFLLQRVAPDPRDRGSSLDMKLEFERLGRISQSRGAASYTTRRGSKIYLPFQQSLVEVGGRREHPLLRAAQTLREDHAPAPEPVVAVESPSPAKAPEASAADWLEGASSGHAIQPTPPRRPSLSESGLDWLESASDPSTPQREIPASRRPPPPKPETGRLRRGGVAASGAHRPAPRGGSSGRNPAVERSGPHPAAGRSGAAPAARRRSESGSGSQPAVSPPGAPSAPRRRRRLGASSSGSHPALERPSGTGSNPDIPHRRASGRMPKVRASGSHPAIGANTTAGPPSRTVDPHRRGPGAEEAEAVACLVSAVLGDPVVLSRTEPRVVGRASSADIQIKSDLISRAHAKISWMGAGFQVEDLGSLNGTFLNGFRLRAPCLLHGGDRLSFGGFEVVVHVLDGPDVRVETSQHATRVFVAGKDLLTTSPVGFGGDLGQLTLKDVVEIVAWKGHSGKLVITDDQAHSGHVYFADGRIAHAAVGKWNGREAARQLLSVKKGRFTFTCEAFPGPRTIAESNESLLKDL
ncbi:MAG: FHA domain-containing protein [Planctomycetes bacterium]|nr:FHA domain-containing protein [Planctomycetota bacterium]